MYLERIIYSLVEKRHLIAVI